MASNKSQCHALAAQVPNRSRHVNALASGKEALVLYPVSIIDTQILGFHVVIKSRVKGDGIDHGRVGEGTIATNGILTVGIISQINKPIDECD